MNYYVYGDMTTMYIPGVDRVHLAHKGGRRTMVDGQQPVGKALHSIAMRTRSRVAKSLKHIALMKGIPMLRELQKAARAKRVQRDADVSAGRPVSPLPDHVYQTAADRKKIAAAKRKRKSWQRWDLARCRKSNPLAERRGSDSSSSDCSDGWY
jgi:hypothetical protein